MISVTVLTKNSQKYIREVLQALKSFDEVLVYDTGSKDETVQIAQTFANVRVVRGAFIGFGPTHNEASRQAKYFWILSIDSDEVVSAEMAEAIQQLQLDPMSVYSFPRHNYYRGKWIRWCGWYPDRQIRLYCKANTQFSDAQVHESILSAGMQHVALEAPLRHYSYDSIAEFLGKMQVYSDLFALQNKGKKKSSPWKALGHAAFAFIKSYFLKRGFLGGYEGFLISAYNGHTAFYKYLKLYEANLTNVCEPPQVGR